MIQSHDGRRQQEHGLAPFGGVLGGAKPPHPVSVDKPRRLPLYHNSIHSGGAELPQSVHETIYWTDKIGPQTIYT